jgi:MFS transporter, putative metabolite:H+ symporter
MLIGSLSDRFGRYRLLLITIGITALGSFLDATATGVATLSIWRFLTGMGVGADLNLVSTYVGELAPAGQRGRITNITFLLGIIGQAVTPFVALALVPNFSYGWRLLFVVGGVIAAVGFAARFELPESPRWLALHGRTDEAEAIVARMEATARARGIPLPEPHEEEVSLQRGKLPFSALLALPYLIMAFLADRVERRLLIFASTLVWLAGMLMVGTLASEAVLTAGSFLASLALGLYLQVAYTYTAESFPTRARASGFALSDGLGHGGGALGALVLPSVSFFAGFAGIGITGAVAGLIALLGPRVSGRSLEQVSR